MRGSIIERGDSYRIKVSLGKDAATGKYSAYYETVRGTKAEAQKRLRQLLTELDKGSFVKPGKNTLSEYLSLWLADYVRPTLAGRTHELYSYTCQKHIIPALGQIPLAALKPQHLQHLYSDKLASGLSKRTVQLIHVTLHKALRNAVKAGLLVRNVAEAVEAPKAQRPEMHSMSESDVHLFLEMARSTEYYSLFYSALFTGMRRAELLALRWCDMDLLLCQASVTRSMQYLPTAEAGSRISFKEPKTQYGKRLISLSPSNVAVLREHQEAQNKLRASLGLPELDNDDLVFCHWDGKPYLPGGVSHAWLKLARKCGLEGIHLHSARHTHASLLLKQGVHPKVVQERLGHASIQITLDTYSHVAPGLQQAAANKFDDIVLPKATADSN